MSACEQISSRGRPGCKAQSPCRSLPVYRTLSVFLSSSHHWIPGLRGEHWAFLPIFPGDPSLPPSSSQPGLGSTLADNPQRGLQGIQEGSPNSLETQGWARAPSRLAAAARSQAPNFPFSTRHHVPPEEHSQSRAIYQVHLLWAESPPGSVRVQVGRGTVLLIQPSETPPRLKGVCLQGAHFKERKICTVATCM